MISTWNSSNPSVASVSKGTVKALKAGTTTITAYLHSESEPKATCVVTVSDAPATLSSVRLNTTTLTIQEGATYSLPGDFRLTAVMSDGSTRDVTSSASWSILSGSQNISLSGLTLTGLKKTSSPAYLQCSYTYNGVTKDATVNVTVTEKAAPTVQSLSASSFSMTVGESCTMTGGSKFKVYAKMSDGTTNEVTGSATYTVVSQNPSGTVSQNGNVIIGNKAGTGTIRASYGGKTVDFTFTVTEKTVPVTSVSLNKSSMSVAVNGSETLSVTFNNGGEVPTNTSVSWSSSQPGIAKVDQYGRVTGVAVGTCDVTVTTADGGKRASCHVTVTPEVIAVTGVSVAPTTASLVVGGTATLTATVSPSNASNKNVSWESSNSNVVSVSGSGDNVTITGKGVGQAKITVTTEDGYRTASCQVTVTAAPTPVEWVKIYDNDGEITSRKDVPNGGSLTLEAITNDGASIASYEWSSTSRNVTISSPSRQYTDIQFNAMEQVSVSVKVTDKNGGYKTATVQFNVINFEYLIDPQPRSLEWKWNEYGSGQKKSVSVTYTNVTNPSISVSGPFSANFENGNNINKIVVYPTQESASGATGSITISDKAGKAKQQKISLEQTAKPAVKPHHIVLSTKNGASTTIWDSNTVTLVASVIGDDNNVMSGEGVSWNYDSSYLNGSESGMELTLSSKAFKDGGVSVTAYAKSDGNIKESITIYPNLHVTGVSLNQTSLALRKGETYQLTASVTPSGATNKGVSWSSSNSNAVSVSNDGLITVKQESSATITVTTSDGSKTATCEVSVPVSATSVTISDIDGNTDGEYDKNHNSGVINLKAMISPSGASPNKVVWSVSGSCVSIQSSEDLSCKLKINSVGNATIYAKWEGDQSVAGSLSITITDAQQYVSFTGTTEYSIKVGETKTLSTGVYAGSNTFTTIGKFISWYAGDWTVKIDQGDCIQLDQTNNTIMGLAAGTATISLQSTGKSSQNTVKVTVTEPDPTISVDASDPFELKVGESKTVKATLNGNAPSSSWSWSSSSTGIVSISGSGNQVQIKGEYVGNTTVTVSYGSASASFKVNVSQAGQSDVMVVGLDPQVDENDGSRIKIIASFMNVVTYADWTEDVTGDVTISNVSSGLKVTKSSPSAGNYYLVVSATKNGNYSFTVSYGGESIDLHVSKSSGQITIY